MKSLALITHIAGVCVCVRVRESAFNARGSMSMNLCTLERACDPPIVRVSFGVRARAVITYQRQAVRAIRVLLHGGGPAYESPNACIQLHCICVRACVCMCYIDTHTQ